LKPGTTIDSNIAIPCHISFLAPVGMLHLLAYTIFKYISSAMLNFIMKLTKLTFFEEVDILEGPPVESGKSLAPPEAPDPELFSP